MEAEQEDTRKEEHRQRGLLLKLRDTLSSLTEKEFGEDRKISKVDHVT
jgi:hypothetical protein